MSSVIHLKELLTSIRRAGSLSSSSWDLIFKSDQEPALQDLLNLIGRKRVSAKTFYELSPVGSSASNGVAEREVQTVEGQIRVPKDALETRLGVTVASNHNILAWVVEFAGTLVNSTRVGHDGKTPYEGLEGKYSRLRGLEFGELVNFRRTPAGSRLAKLDSLWSDGVFLGYNAVSGEMIIGTAAGVFRTRTFQRKALEHRWTKEIWTSWVGYHGEHRLSKDQKRPAEGSADESRDTDETEGDSQVDLVDICFAAYEECGGLGMACREPEEDMRESDEQFQEEDEGDEDWRAGGGFKDDRTGKFLDPTKGSGSKRGVVERVGPTSVG